MTSIRREALHKSSGKQALRIGVDRKAKTAVIPVGIARIFNAAGHPRPQMHPTFDLCRASLGAGSNPASREARQDCAYACRAGFQTRWTHPPGRPPLDCTGQPDVSGARRCVREKAQRARASSSDEIAVGTAAAGGHLLRSRLLLTAIFICERQ